MTTIVAVEGENDIKFAWDSQTTWMGRAMLGGVKVFENGPVTFGVAGGARSADILKHMSIPDRKDYEPGYNNESWIVRTLVPAIVAEFKEVEASDAGSFDTDSHIILVVGGEIGYLSSNLSWVTDSSGVYAVGSGSDYAIGALMAGVSVKRAVEIASQWDLYTGGDVVTKTIKKEKKRG